MWRKQKENGATQTGYTVSYIGLSFRTPLEGIALFTGFFQFPPISVISYGVDW